MEDMLERVAAGHLPHKVPQHVLQGALDVVHKQFKRAYGFDLPSRADLTDLVHRVPEAREVLSQMPVLAGGWMWPCLIELSGHNLGCLVTCYSGGLPFAP